MNEPVDCKEVDPREAWSIILAFISFFAGVAIFSTHSRLIGSLLMGVPAALFIAFLLRTPRQNWRRLAVEVARTKRAREGRPRMGRLWVLYHRFGGLLEIVSTVLLIVIMAYAIFA